MEGIWGGGGKGPGAWWCRERGGGRRKWVCGGVGWEVAGRAWGGGGPQPFQTIADFLLDPPGFIADFFAEASPEPLLIFFGGPSDPLPNRVGGGNVTKNIQNRVPIFFADFFSCQNTVNYHSK